MKRGDLRSIIHFFGDRKAYLGRKVSPLEFQQTSHSNNSIKRDQMITKSLQHKESTSMWVLQRHTEVKGHGNTLAPIISYLKQVE